MSSVSKPSTQISWSAKRFIRGHLAACFSPDGNRVYTSARYVDGWQVPTLERLFRVRPLQGLLGIAVQPRGDLILSAHRTGQFALMDGHSGRTLGVCGERGYIRFTIGLACAR
jgi:hypothetical protein